MGVARVRGWFTQRNREQVPKRKDNFEQRVSIDAPLIKGDPPAYRHPPYQGGQGGSNLKSIFNLIITSYLVNKLTLI